MYKFNNLNTYENECLCICLTGHLRADYTGRFGWTFHDTYLLRELHSHSSRSAQLDCSENASLGESKKFGNTGSTHRAKILREIIKLIESIQGKDSYTIRLSVSAVELSHVTFSLVDRRQGKGTFGGGMARNHISTQTT